MLKVLGYASDLGANIAGSSQGPVMLQRSSFLSPHVEWVNIIQSQHLSRGKAALTDIAALNTQLAQEIIPLVKSKHPFLVIGGDHTSAIGTWSGAAAALQPTGSLGLIWFDAHMDSHTWDSSHSGNIHGMPLATLLGHGKKELISIATSSPKLLPQQVCLIGVRSYEAEELELLNQLNVKIYFIEEIEQRGLSAVFTDALRLVQTNTAGFGISFDVDVLDPNDAPAVSTPVSKGLRAADVLDVLKLCRHNKHLLGLEMAEFNPSFDKQQRTEKLIADIVKTVF